MCITAKKPANFWIPGHPATHQIRGFSLPGGKVAHRFRTKYLSSASRISMILACPEIPYQRSKRLTTSDPICGSKKEVVFSAFSQFLKTSLDLLLLGILEISYHIFITLRPLITQGKVLQNRNAGDVYKNRSSKMERFRFALKLSHPVMQQYLSPIAHIIFFTGVFSGGYYFMATFKIQPCHLGNARNTMGLTRTPCMFGPLSVWHPMCSPPKKRG